MNVTARMLQQNVLLAPRCYTARSISTCTTVVCTMLRACQRRLQAYIHICMPSKCVAHAKVVERPRLHVTCVTWRGDSTCEQSGRHQTFKSQAHAKECYLSRVDPGCSIMPQSIKAPSFAKSCSSDTCRRTALTCVEYGDKQACRLAQSRNMCCRCTTRRRTSIAQQQVDAGVSSCKSAHSRRCQQCST